MSSTIESIIHQNPELNLDHQEYNINVTSLSDNLIKQQDIVHYLNRSQLGNHPSHLYFHIPFCNYICKFCNYVKVKLPKNGKPVLSKWLSLILKEAELYLERYPWIRDTPIESIYFGGGTAALLDKEQLAELMTFIRARYNLSKCREISLEGNPDNFSVKSLRAFKESGITRFSVGVQSLQDEVLKYVGRGHSAKMTLDSIQALNDLNLPFNADYMFGLPYQTLTDVQNDMETLCRLDIPTITIYRLRNADRQEMGIGHRSLWNNPDYLAKHKVNFPDVHTTYEIRDMVVEVLQRYGYKASPCGWWSKQNTYLNKRNIPFI